MLRKEFRHTGNKLSDRMKNLFRDLLPNRKWFRVMVVLIVFTFAEQLYYHYKQHHHRQNENGKYDQHVV